MHIGIIGRSKGSTVDSLAYRAGVKLECPLTGEVHDRSSKMVEDVSLSLPKDAPQWALDLKDLINEDRTKGVQEFCNIVEEAENRKDSQVYREFRISIPREFTKAQAKEFINDFVEDQVCGLGITALKNYHFDVNEETGETNPHCHVLALTRGLTETGLAEKNRDWNKKQVHEQWRAQLAAYGNYHLLKNGFEANWDHRSYKDRGINFEPQPKLGSKIINIEKQAGEDPKNIHSTPVTERGREYQEVKLRNLYTLINRPEEALDAISNQQTTFMWGDVAKLLGRYVDDQALFNRLSLTLQQSSELVCLEDNGSYSKSVFTTRTRLAEEGKFIEALQALKGNQSHGVETSVIEGAIQRATESLRESKKDPEASLSNDQINSIKHMAQANQLSFVEGYAGAGKTTVMKVMREIWEESGYQVFGLAPTGKAAENLADCGIESDVVHRFLKLFENGRSQYDSQTILVLDEAGMVDGRCFGDLIKAVEKLGVKLVASGDLGQLSPIEAGIPFRMAVKEVGKADLTTVLRQKIDWQRKATVLFGEGRAAEALKSYDDNGLIKTVEEKYSALNDIANQKIKIEEELSKVSGMIRARGVSDKNSDNVNALFHKLETLDQQNTFVSDLVHQKDYKGVVELYNLSRRISGNISSEIRKDIEQDKLRELAVEQANLAKGIEPSKQKKPSDMERFYAHKDSEFFSEWQGVRDEASKVMVRGIESYRSHMHELGVDGIDFCRKYNGYDEELGGYDENEAHKLAKKLGIDWRGTAKHLCDPRLNTKNEMVDAWFRSTVLNPKDTHTMMSYSNKDVQHLNAMARDKMRASGVLGKEEYIYTIERTAGDDLGKQKFVNEERKLSVGDQIVFTKIDKGLGVKNGTLGRVTALSKDNIEAVIKKDGEDKAVSFSPNLYKRFDNGWAVTLHKNQGVTVDWAFVLSSFEQYKNLTYVAMTRHAKNVQMFVSDIDFWRKDKIFDRLDRHQDKLAAMDYVSGDELLSLLKSDEKYLNASLKKVGQKFEAIGYVGQRVFTSVCDKFLGRTPESNQIRISKDLTENLKSEADRADEKFRPVSVVDITGSEKSAGDHGQALGPQQESSKPESTLNVKVVAVEKKSSPVIRKTQPQPENSTTEDKGKFKGESPSDEPRRGQKRPKYDLQKLVKDVEVSVRVEELAKDILGAQNLNSSLSNSSQLRFGRKGSLKVNLTGSYVGTWKNWERNEKGGILDLVQKEKGLDFKGSLSYVRDYCRGSVPNDIDAFLKGEKGREVSPAERQAEIDAAKLIAQEKEAEAQALKESKRQDVVSLIEKTVPITGTPAETYLRKERGIQRGLPESLRYVPAGTRFVYNGNKNPIKTGALLSLATDKEGSVKAIQLTHLTQGGTKAVHDDGSKLPKRTYGVQKGSFVELQKGDEKSPIIVAEGVETALSVKESGIKGTILCSLGTTNMKNLNVRDREIIIAADWDGSRDVPSWKTTERTQAALQEKGNDVTIILPVKNPELTKEKVDFNDLLKEGGLSSVIDRVSDQVPGAVALEAAPREIQKENEDNQRSPTLSRNQEGADGDKHDSLTKPVQVQAESLEKDSPVLDGEALKANIVAYFEHELSLEKNEFMNRGNVFKHVHDDPVDYLKWWQRHRGGAEFDPHVPFSEQQSVSAQGDKDSSPSSNERPLGYLMATDDFAKDVQDLKNIITLLENSGRSPDRLSRYSKKLDDKLLGVNEKTAVMNDLKERYPEIAEEAIQIKQERQQIQHQEQSMSHGHGLER
ncbi:MAG: AAA family ATPase [Simkaniaceae bacterium]|nr:AAA family ATPase [Simkaniaceae bacterium]